jgi:hypothetical protein
MQQQELLCMKAAAHRDLAHQILLEDAGIKCDVENSYLSFSSNSLNQYFY